MSITNDTLNFLKALEANNNREWFNENKSIFKSHEANAKAFFQEIEKELNTIDNISGHKVYRIYRDVRFSKDKSPYKNRFAGGFTRATAALRGGYYLNIEPGNSGVGGGFYSPNKEDLQRIRQEVAFDPTPLQAILNETNFKQTFGELQGDALKTAPRGYNIDSPGIEILQKKQFILFKSFTDKEVISPDFLKNVIETYSVLRPFFDYMSDVLTTDENGTSIL